MAELSTIFALSTGRLPSAIAVLRVSGSLAAATLGQIAGIMPEPRIATRATLRSRDGSPLDDAVVLWFPGPRSVTGEDVAEFHIHGSRAVASALVTVLQQFGLHPAEAGEFTRRAFENGKLDLTSAEGLDDLIHADTEMQRRQALRQYQGLLGQRAESWRKQIIAASAMIEAGIDFPDEGDVPEDLLTPALTQITALRSEIEEVLAAQAQSERLRDGVVIAIAGPPNAGKSTLLNRLARRDAAIVSPHAGTTRDVIEVQLDLAGYPVVLLDTAGIRDSDDPVEQEGVRRARTRAAAADLVLWLSESTVQDEAANQFSESGRVWRVRTKADLAPDIAGERIDHRISAVSGEGVAALVSALADFAAQALGAGESAVITRARHRALLEDTAAGLRRAEAAASLGAEIVAEELRTAIHFLGRLLGRVDIEDVLDGIFRDFCIGK